ncbi:unnamed protein product [Cercopithifilaria johnstoni]|uniref:Uncharacterized protein n=1 Tax=Cercopithifilaria johnstoni TaxID=2874296 RepID=A0A8J2LZZ3_9BILA|nr:unnamed protein product [Cercopithifilaria johnstoni]
MLIDEDDDNDDNDSDSDGNDWTESDVDTYISDEAVPLDDELIHVYDLADHWGEDNNMGPNEFSQELIDDTERQNAQYNLVDRSRSVSGSGMDQARSIDDAEEGIDDDDNIMDWTTTSDVIFIIEIIFHI